MEFFRIPTCIANIIATSTCASPPGRQYIQELSDRQVGRTVQKQLTEGLAKIDSIQLPRKYGAITSRCTIDSQQSSIYSSQQGRWHLQRLRYIRKLSDAGLFDKNMLQLPLKSINIKFKQEKTRLTLELRKSRDQMVRGAEANVHMGCKWKAQPEVDQAISRM